MHHHLFQGSLHVYPSVKFNQIESAVNFFLRDAPQRERDLAKQRLELVQFGMCNTLIQSIGQYYEYGGSVDVEAKGLTIGGYELAFFADLVAAWILENTVKLMFDTMFDGLYRDDGLLVFGKPKTTDEVCDWLSSFQKEVNALTESQHLQLSQLIFGIQMMLHLTKSHGSKQCRFVGRNNSPTSKQNSSGDKKT